MTIEDETYEEDVIFDKPSKNEDYEKFHQKPWRVLFLKSPPVRNNPRPHKSSEARNRQEYQPISESEAYEMQFLLIYKQKQCEWDDDCYRTAVNVMFAQMSAIQGIKQFKERAMAAIVK